MFRMMIVLPLFSACLSIGFAQPAYYAYDSDTLIKVGLSPDYGYFGIELTDGRVLTYGGAAGGGGGTIHMNFYVDGTVYTTDPFLVGATHITPASSDTATFENLIITDWFPYDSVQFTQTLHPFSIDSQGAVTIRYNIVNRDTVAHDVGVLLLLDTNLNGRDDAPFYFPGDTTAIDSTLILPGISVPLFFQVYEYGPWYTDTQIVARCQLQGAPNVKPDWVVIGNQRTLADVVWNVVDLPDELITDGAMLFVWGPLTVEAGGGASFATTYGIAPEGEFIGGPLGARIEVPRTLRIQFCSLLPNPITFSTMFRNNTDSTMFGAVCSLAFDDSRIEVDPDTMIHLADTLLPAQMQTVAWQVLIPDSALPETDTYIYYELFASADTMCEGDTFGTTITAVHGSIYVYGSTYLGPMAEIVYPDSGTFTSNAVQPLAIYLTDDDVGVAPYSIHWQFVDIMDSVFYDIHPGLVGCTYESDTLYWPNISHSNGDVVRYYLRPTYDLHGCPLQEEIFCSYTYDLTPPLFRGYYPPDDTIMNDSLFYAWVYVIDAINRILPTSVMMTIADDDSVHTHTYPEPPLYFESAEDTMVFIAPDVADWHWPDGDITITLEQVCDAPDYGEPNCTEGLPFSWSFTMNAHGPRAYPRTPDDGWFVSIPNPDITFYLYDGNGINVSTVQYQVDGVMFGAPLEYGTGDSIIVHTPTGSWTDGYEVYVAVVAAEDTFGTPLDVEGSYPAWLFTIDLTPPLVLSTSPTDAGTTGTSAPLILVQLYDSLAGVNPDSITMNVNDVAYTIEDDALTYSDGWLSWDAFIAGVELSGDVEICVDACDSPDMGNANWMDTYCFSIYALIEAPTVEFANPGISICSDYGAIEVLLTDPDGVYESSIEVIVDSVSYTTADVELDYAGDILTFTPSTAWIAGDTIQFCVTEAMDTWGNSLSEPVCTTFIVDFTPPTIISVKESVFYSWEPPDSAELDSVALLFNFYNEIGLIDSYSTAVYIYDESGTTLLEEFNYLDDPDVVWFNGDSVVFWSGTAFEFVDLSTYLICLHLDDLCYAGSHSDSDYCYLYYATDVDEPQKSPERLTILLPNYPDPFNAATIIPVHTDREELATVEILDINGRLINTIHSGVLPSGITNLRWLGDDSYGHQMPSGVYFVRLCTMYPDQSVQVARICLIR